MDLSNAISAVQEITFQQTFHSLKIISTEIIQFIQQ